MARHIKQPTVIPAAGNKPKIIEEFVGNVNSGDSGLSIARMQSPAGWVEPAQTPEFDEYTVVLDGSITVEVNGEETKVVAGEAMITYKGETVRYSTPDGPAEYIAVCLPAFHPDLVHRQA